jgi:hypothetical protein
VAERTAYEYDVTLELPRVTHQPSIKIDSPAPGSTINNRFVEVSGRAGYPPDSQDPPRIGNVGYPWEGVTNWEVPGSSKPPGTDENADPDPAHPRTVLYMHGNTEEGCTGQGKLDVVGGCDGPFLLTKTQLSLQNAAFWKTGIEDEVFDGTVDRTPYDPNWSWCLAPGEGCAAIGGDVPPGPVTVGGPMTLEWWAQCNLCGGIFSADWNVRVWGDGALKFEQRITAAPATLGVPGRLVKTVTIPTFTANQRIVVHIDPVYVDAQTVTNIYYDSENPCVAAVTTGRCDSLVRMPVGASGGTSGAGGVGPPVDVRVTDLPITSAYPASPTIGALRVAWDPQQGAASYEVYRSTDPVDLGKRVFQGTGTACISPNSPGDAEPGYDRPGRCFTDNNAALRTTYYYRVLSVDSTGHKSANSGVAYGTPTKYDRQVKVRVDRLFGPQYWEYALLDPSPNPTKDDSGTQWRYLWDTLELFPSPYVHPIFGRSFTQGIGSRKDETNAMVGGGGGGSTPDCEAKITDGGWIIARNGDRASFGGNASSDGLGRVTGQEEYQDHGPAQALNLHSIAIVGLTCNSARTEATITGVATVDGQGIHDFQIDVTDAGEPGTSDTYRMFIADLTYDSGEQLLQGGNVQIH